MGQKEVGWTQALDLLTNGKISQSEALKADKC